MGVVMRSAWKNGNDTFHQASGFFQGAPSSCSYSRTYWSTPYAVKMLALPAPLEAALNRVVEAIT